MPNFIDRQEDRIYKGQTAARAAAPLERETGERAMNVLVGGTFAVSFVTLAGLASTNAQTAPHRAPHKTVHESAKTPVQGSPLPAGVELQTSTSASAGSESYYFSSTVAAGQTDLLDLSYRYGQSPPAHHTGVSLFHF
jgi:hypothetical protein